MLFWIMIGPTLDKVTDKDYGLPPAIPYGSYRYKDVEVLCNFMEHHVGPINDWQRRMMFRVLTCKTSKQFSTIGKW